ncbi:MAG: sugar transferase [Lachnospiraceae bacterium]|uniref:sugar transferase n=1 Tax=Roseburia hominis TaxID=301301 RepID=UPI001F2C0C65|nr:sugar transferase [Roseburia hominis]MCI5711937.1 sugar transferase [Lachnospiraceae bacterium]MDD6168979.1 sugar transferase [Lachnospiraceae bacterium]MDY4837954.1 sugar transferase [Lachnospiraceae bacterium]
MYKKERKSWAKHLDFILLDILCLQLAFMISYFIRLGISLPYWNEPYQRLAIILVLLDICVAFFTEAYKGILRRNKFQELQAVIIHCTTVFVGLLVYMYAIKQSAVYSRQMLFVYLFFSIVFEFIGRILLKKNIRKRILNSRYRSVMIIVTTKECVEECLKNFENMEYTEFSVNGVVVVDEQLKGTTIRGIPVVANADDFFEYVRTNVVDEVFINGNTRQSSEALANDLLEMGITVHYSLVKETQMVSNRVIENLGNYLVLTSSMKIASPRQLFVKRLMDIVGSMIGLILTGIAFLIFAPIIKKQSPGPIFFSQVRVGKNGRQFKFYKFRSMNVNAEEQKKDLMAQNEMEGHMFKMADDPRIFPIGKFMRKYSIDELPQFFNILKGDMSLVGTRPPTVEEFENYDLKHKARLGIKPGLTGMWQVSGRSEIKNFEEVVGLDTYYISHWDLGLDIKILLKTIQVVLTGRGSE